MYTTNAAGKSGPSAPPIKSQVQGSMERIDETVAELHGHIDALTDRLSTVLRSEPSVAPNQVPQAISNNVILSNKIDSATDRVQSAVARISDILTRLEV